jgi:hypothetical protein
LLLMKMMKKEPQRSHIYVRQQVHSENFSIWTEVLSIKAPPSSIRKEEGGFSPHISQVNGRVGEGRKKAVKTIL